MTFTHAITRRPGKEMAAGITTSTLGPPDYTKALDQFDAYVNTWKDIPMPILWKMRPWSPRM